MTQPRSGKPYTPRGGRTKSGTWVFIHAGQKILLATKRGVSIIDEAKLALKVILQEQLEKVIGRVILVDSKGNLIPIMEALGANAVSITNFVNYQTRIVSCPTEPIGIPGSDSSGAYTANDAMGTLFTVDVPKSGIIYGATLWDLDDEGLQIDLELFKSSITQIASEALWAPSDFDILAFIAEIQFFAFDDHDTSQTSEVKNFGKAYNAPEGKFWIQAVTRGTPTIAAGSEPRIQLHILSDDPNWEA